jgi:hypothetical protein
LRTISADLYETVYQYLENLWQTNVSLVCDLSFAEGKAFLGKVWSHPYVHVDGIRYCAGMASQGGNSRFAYVSNRQPVEILYIFSYTMPADPEDGVPLTLSAQFSIIRPLVAPSTVPEFPWDLWYQI